MEWIGKLYLYMVRLQMGIHEYIWVYRGIHGNVWVNTIYYRGVHGYIMGKHRPISAYKGIEVLHGSHVAWQEQ